LEAEQAHFSQIIAATVAESLLENYYDILDFI